MQYKNLIWDFDGMLFNTYPRMATAFCQALKELGVDVGYDEVMAKIKLSVRKGVADYAERYGLDRDDLNARYQRIEHSMPAESMIPYEGMCELLKAAVDAGGRHYLYTHRDDSALEALERYGVRELFSGAITALDHFPSKPAPDALLSLMAKNSLSPEQTLMLGDRDIDIMAARNAGIEGGLFDPEHFYDDFDVRLRSDTVNGLRKLLNI